MCLEFNLWNTRWQPFIKYVLILYFLHGYTVLKELKVADQDAVLENEYLIDVYFAWCEFLPYLDDVYQQTGQPGL